MTELDSRIQGLTEAREKLDDGIREFFQMNTMTQESIEMVSRAVRLSKEEVKARGKEVSTHQAMFNPDTVRRVLTFIRDGEVSTYRDVAFALGDKDQHFAVGRLLAQDRNIEALAAPVIHSKGSSPNFFIEPGFETKNGKEESRAPFLEQRGINFSIWKDGRIRIPGNQHVTGETLLKRMSA